MNEETLFKALHDQTVWNGLSEPEQDAAARAVEALLPPARGIAGWGLNESAVPQRLTLHRIRAFASSGQPRVAQYALGDTGKLFSLIIGGEQTLGFAPTPDFPSRADKREWKRFEKDGWGTLDRFLAQCMTPLRAVTLAPYLVEAVPVGVETRTALDGEYAGKFSIFGMTWNEVSELLTGTGFRLPTSDEWEAAYAGGSRAVWPEWSKQPGGSGQSLRNALGLAPMSPMPNGYWGEYCGTPNILRGGDAGVTNCAGCGGLPAMLADASAFYFECEVDGEYMAFRRTLSVPLG